jgi:DNA polymerase-3 subunit chi
MTRIIFHVNVPQPLEYACRLLRKAYRVGAKMAVWGAPETLQALDRLLWTFDPTEFIPHATLLSWGGHGPEIEPEGPGIPIYLLTDVQATPSSVVFLLNLHDKVVEPLNQFERVIEIISNQEPHLQSARQRWKRYVAAGYSPEKHEAKL